MKQNFSLALIVVKIGDNYFLQFFLKNVVSMFCSWLTIDNFYWIKHRFFSVPYMEYRRPFPQRSPGSSVGQALAYWSSGTEFEPRSRRNLLNCKRCSIAHSLSLSFAHRPDMTEILLKDVKSQVILSSIHPSPQSLNRQNQLNYLRNCWLTNKQREGHLKRHFVWKKIRIHKYFLFDFSAILSISPGNIDPPKDYNYSGAT